MTHRIPPGTRDVLPDEMRELRALTDRLRAAFERGGYGEVWTPSLEYEEVLRRGDDRAAGAGYRLFDEHGEVLALRSDMTIPIARVVATRYGEAEPPFRMCYFGHAYRAVERGTGQLREFLQGGIELIGAPAPEGDAEVVALTLSALEEAGLRRHRIGIGDGSLYRSLLESLDVPGDTHLPLLECLSRRDLAGLELRVDRLGLPERDRDLLVRLPELRGGPDVLERPDGPLAADAARGAVEGLRALHELLAERGVADRVIFDLGLVRELGYYTGAVFEVYDPAVGFALGGGGRYDDLIGRFGRALPACGIGLDVQRIHIAQAEEERQA
jgi:ATP phosphoribosyltransferase regulatory subunit